MKAALDSSQGVSVKSPISVGSHVTVGLTSGTTLDGKESKPRPLVDYKGRWMSPADMTNAMMAEKGLVLSDGQWISAKDNETNETKENTAKGLVEYKGKWMTPTDVSNAMNAATVEPQSPVSDTKPNEHARTEIQSDAAPEDRQAVLCAKCGTKCSLDAKFCTNCGVAMNAQTQTKNTPSSQSATFTGLLHYALVLVKIVKIGGAVAAIGVFIVVGWVVIRRTRWLHSASASEGNLEESSSALKGRFRSIAKGQRSIRTIVILGGAQLLVLLTMWNCSSRSIKVEHQQSTDFYAKQHAEHIGDISASAEGSRLIIAFKYSPEQKNPHFTNTRYILAYALFDENGARVAFGATTICFEPDIVESWSRGVRYNSELVKPGNNRIAVVVPKRDLREAAMVRIAIERDNR